MKPSLALPQSGLSTLSQRSRRRLAALLVATALAPAAMPLLPGTDGVPGISRALARENITIDKIEIPTAIGPLTLNKVVVTGSSLSRAEFEGLFKAGDIASVASLIEKFDADKLAIDTIVMKTDVAGSTSTTTYNGVVLTSIRRGVVGEFIAAAADSESIAGAEGKGMKIKATYGRMSIAEIDIPYAIKWYTTADSTGNAPKKRLYGANAIEFMRMTSDIFDLEIGRMTNDFVEARLPRTQISARVAELMASPPGKDDTNAAARMFSWLLEAYDSIGIGRFDSEGGKFTGKDAASTVSGSFGKMAFTGGAKPGGKMSDFAFSETSTKSHFKLAELGFTGDTYGAVLFLGANAILLGSGTGEKALTPEAKATLEKSLAATSSILTRSDVGFSLRGFDMDAPAKQGGPSTDRVKASVADFSAVAGNFVAVTPTKIGLALKNFKMDLPKNSKDAGIQNLRELGVETLDLSANISAAWDEKTSRIDIPEISVDVDKLAKTTIKGELAGVPRAVFEKPTVNWPQLLATGNVRTLSTEVVNRGGLDKLVAKTAREQGQDPTQFRAQISMMAPAMIGAVMAGHPDAVKVSNAVAAFLKSLASLSVTVKAISPDGITVPEIMGAASNPATLLPKVTIEAAGK